MTASWVARSRWARSRAGGPVIQRLSPLPVAIWPSSVVASFSVTSGRPRRWRIRKPALISAASSAPSPVSTAMPARAQPGDALAGDARIGILERRPPTRGDAGGDQRVGAGRGLAPMAAGLEGDIGGGAARRGPARRSASVSPCGRPPGWVQPRPTTRPRDPARTRPRDPSLDRETQPTAGLGQTVPSPRRASASAARISAGRRCDRRPRASSVPRPQLPSAAMRPTNSPKSLASRKLR